MPEDPEPRRDVVSFGRERRHPRRARPELGLIRDGRCRCQLVDLVCEVARRINRSVLALRLRGRAATRIAARRFDRACVPEISCPGITTSGRVSTASSRRCGSTCTTAGVTTSASPSNWWPASHACRSTPTCWRCSTASIRTVADVMEDWSLGKTRRGPSRPPPRWPIDCV